MCTSISFCLPIYLSIYLSLSLSIFLWPGLYLCISLSLSLSAGHRGRSRPPGIMPTSTLFVLEKGVKNAYNFSFWLRP